MGRLFRYRASVLIFGALAIAAVVLALVWLFSPSFASAALGSIKSVMSAAWDWYHCNREDVTPLAAGLGGALLAWIAFGQMRTARLRHAAQTEADLQRRITESFSKAVEQLGSDKLEVRLGGIYSLERISKESDSDYFSVMETLCAFVRDKARWKGTDDKLFASLLEEPKRPSEEVPTDIAGALSVICRRGSIEREKKHDWRIDLRATDLRSVTLSFKNLNNATLNATKSEDPYRRTIRHLVATLFKGKHRSYFVNLENAKLNDAHLENADLRQTNLRGADLKGATVVGAKFEDADFQGTVIKDVDLERAHLDGAKNLDGAIASPATRLPPHIKRPAKWPPAAV